MIANDFKAIAASAPRRDDLAPVISSLPSRLEFSSLEWTRSQQNSGRWACCLLPNGLAVSFLTEHESLRDWGPGLYEAFTSEGVTLRGGERDMQALLDLLVLMEPSGAVAA